VALSSRSRKGPLTSVKGPTRHFASSFSFLLDVCTRTRACAYTYTYTYTYTTYHRSRVCDSTRRGENAARTRRDILRSARGTYITVPAVWVRGRAATFVVYSVYRTGVPYSDSSSSLACTSEAGDRAPPRARYSFSSCRERASRCTASPASDQSHARCSRSLS